MYEYVFDVHTSKVSKGLKVVLVPTTRPLAHKCKDDSGDGKTAPQYYYKLYNQCRLATTVCLFVFAENIRFDTFFCHKFFVLLVARV
jgi:hypothetical protein